MQIEKLIYGLLLMAICGIAAAQRNADPQPPDAGVEEPVHGPASVPPRQQAPAADKEEAAPAPVPAPCGVVMRGDTVIASWGPCQRP